MSTFITERVESGIQILCLDRVDKKNAITLDMYQALADALQRAEGDDDIKVTMLHGAGGDFSSGNDINEFLQIAHAPEKMAVTMTFLQVLSHYKKPLIAAVEGKAVGVGATMLLHCDLVLASREARLQFPFVKLGLVPEAASSCLLPQLIGHQRAFEILMMGDFVEAQFAYEMGLVNNLCEAGEAYQVALRYAQKVAALPLEAVVLTKGLMKASMHKGVQSALVREGEIFKDRLCSSEANQAFDTFLNRHKSF